MAKFRRWRAVQVCKYTPNSRSSDKNVFKYFISTYSVSYYSSLCYWLVDRPLPSSTRKWPISKPKIVHLASFWKWGFGPKPSLSKWGQVHNLSCENEFDLQWKVISISKAEHLTSFWYRGLGELGSGLMFSHLFWRDQTGIVFFGGKFDSSLVFSPL